MKRKFASRSFGIGLLAGLAFIAFRLFKYGGGTRNDFSIYVATTLSFGIAGAILGWVGSRIWERIRKKK